jgi:hypothetical protein
MTGPDRLTPITLMALKIVVVACLLAALPVSVQPRATVRDSFDSLAFRQGCGCRTLYWSDALRWGESGRGPLAPR